MQISQINNTQNFQGIPLGKAKVADRSGKIFVFDLYKITPNDKLFLRKLQSDIDVRNLQSGLCEEKYNQWEKIIHLALNCCQRNGSGLLLTKENVPCAIMSYVDKPNGKHLQELVCWQTQKDEAIPLRAKTLIMQLFKETLDENLSWISTYAMKDSILCSPIAKFMGLGFKPLGQDVSGFEFMRINKENLIKSYANLQKCIQLSIQNSPSEVDLNSVLRTTKNS